LLGGLTQDVFQAILTDQGDENLAMLECRHRQHARVEDRIRDDKDTGLAKFPFKEHSTRCGLRSWGSRTT
jgi:hypothetical protein